ncbi:Ecm30 protein [Saccharomycopsis crataegensis]|uniref:Ecm30 protein n=1 Tax=Saccharomycopsis crataegensis TaxID=43959 RepID=A0AAV5QIU2_9ASCO|nr:Ecm30 protein [Saccharomycopsis crataegensis]
MVPIADEKLKLKKKFFRLAQPPILSPNDPYWNFLWSHTYDSDDIFHILTANDIKYIKSKNPINFYSFIRIVSVRLIHLANHPGFPNTSDASTNQLLNCCRLLTRFFPFIFEGPKANRQEMEIFWQRNNNDNYLPEDLKYHNTTNSMSSTSPNTATVGSITPPNSLSNMVNDSASMNVNIHNSDQLSETNSKKVVINGDGSYKKFKLPLGAQLVHVCIDLLFTKHFTIMEENMHLKGRDFQLWEPGIGQNGKFKAPEFLIDANRLEIIRLLVVLCSKTLYSSPQKIVDNGSKFLTALVTSLPKMKLLAFICSLLNISIRECSFSSFDNPINEPRYLLATYSVQLFALTLSYAIPSEDIDFVKNLNIINPGSENSQIFPPSNLVRLYLSKLHKPSELQYIIKSYLQFLQKPMIDLKNTLDSPSRFNLLLKSSEAADFPKSKKIPSWTAEVIMILWELIQCNKSFVKFLVLAKNSKTEEFFSNEIFVTLSYYIFAYESSSQNQSTKRIISYLILYMTAVAPISKNLLKRINLKLYDLLIPKSLLQKSMIENSSIVTYRDFVVYKVSWKLVNDVNMSADLLTPTYFELLYNLVPITVVNNNNEKIKNDINTFDDGLSYNCCSTLTQLIIKLSSRSTLLENKMNPDLLSLLIRSVVNAILFNRYHLDKVKMLVISAVKNERTYRNVLHLILSMIDESDESGHESTRNGNDHGNDDIDMTLAQEDNFHDLELYQAFRPVQPVGMSEKAKGKLPINASLSQTWNGSKCIKILLRFIEIMNAANISGLKNNTDSFETPKSLMSKIIIPQNMNSEIMGIDNVKTFLGNTRTYKPLKFNWSAVSLGWYLSVLWGKIFITEEAVHFEFEDASVNGSGLLPSGLVSSLEGFWIGNDNGMVSEHDGSTSNLPTSTVGRLFSRFGWENKQDGSKENGDDSISKKANESDHLQKVIMNTNFFKHTKVTLFKIKSANSEKSVRNFSIPPVDKDGHDLDANNIFSLDNMTNNLMNHFSMLRGANILKTTEETKKYRDGD